MPVRRVNLFNIAGALFQSRQRVAPKAINLTDRAEAAPLILMNVLGHRGRSPAEAHEENQLVDEPG